METVTVVYHLEDGAWWVEAPSVPEFVGGGDTFEEARTQAQEGLAFTLEREVELDERFDDPAMQVRRATSFHIQTPAHSNFVVTTGALTFSPVPHDVHTTPSSPRAAGMADSAA